MSFKTLIAALSLVTVFAVLDGSSASAQIPNENKKPATNVIVQPGDNLSKIATVHSTTYIRLYDANAQIADPDVIHPNDNLRVPASDEQLASRPLPGPPQPAAPAPTTRQQPAASAPVKQKRSSVRQPSPAPTVYSNGGGVWDSLARCESGGNWAINTGNGYYGGLQFSLSSWKAVGGSGYPHQASKSEQIARGEMLKARQGWGAWPACTAKLGIR